MQLAIFNEFSLWTGKRPMSINISNIFEEIPLPFNHHIGHDFISNKTRHCKHDHLSNNCSGIVQLGVLTEEILPSIEGQT
jgi:hypothetical protein